MVEEHSSAPPPSSVPSPPGTLDLNAWLAFSLASPHEVERRLALDEIGFQGLTEAFVDDLQRLAATDPAAACRTAAARLLERARQAAAARPVETIELTPERTRALLEVGEDALQQVVLRSLRKAPAPEILDTWRAHLPSEENAEVIGVGLTLLARHGRPEDASLALLFSSHPSASVVKTAIDLLHGQNPGQFKEGIVRFLTSDDLEIRLHTIRKLRTFDPREAQTYLRSLLAARDPFIRQRALRELLLVPFAESEALYLAYLAAEPLPLLLVLAGSAVAMNPAPDLPPKLYDVFLSARDLRARILQLVINQLLVSIKASGILQEPIETYLETLKSTLQKRKLWVTARLALADLDHDDPEVRLAAIDKLSQARSFPKVQEALERREAIETVDEVREALARALGREKESFTIAGFRARIKDGSFYGLDPRVQKRFISAIADEDSFREARDIIGIAVVADLERGVLLHLLDRIAAHGRQWDPKCLFRYLKSDDPGILAAALRAIGRLDLDAIAYEIPNLLRHDDFRVKMAALELYLVSDKASALQYLIGMLKAQQVKIRKNGLALLATVDYPSAERILLDYFPVEKNLEAKLQAGFILAANPTLEGIQVLYAGCHDERGALLPPFQDLWESALEAAVPLLAPDAATLLASCRSRRSAEQTAAAAEPPTYAFKKITAATNKNLFAEKDAQPTEGLGAELRVPEPPAALEQAAGAVERYRMPLAAAAVVLLAVGLWWIAGDRLLGPGAGGGGPAVVHEARANRMEEGSRDVPAMVAGRRGGSSSFISGRSYAQVMKAMDAERQSVSEEFHRKNKEALREVLMQMLDDPSYKGYGEFYLNENCAKGMEAIEQGDLAEARTYLRKALDDPTISEEARVIVCQGLMQVGFELGDKESLQKALETFLATIPEKDLPKGYDRMRIKEAFSGLERLHDVTPEQYKVILQTLAQKYPGKVSPAMQEQMLEGFKQMQNRFRK
ncbi:MAG: hypothetical protein OZSIB_0121 [Candidatus Ozemobacter sibiricus]|jgi:hypothetical protein|uniref:HEAT repeat domain-containing protein n=1 Tax=Candidatus Ozemobacter sibiricus TaxID=2268124 RepID=A0A367ZMH9_9BACT|nr:MAG: hypothetical protein OZSIB_0121 [Candidatus Ozemobacter sibiricus]